MNTQIDLINPIARESIAKQYQQLVYKIANQQKYKTALSYEDVVGFGEEGLATAINNYDPTKGQTFKQYAGYMILYYIQNGSNTEGHTVHFSAYMQKKARDRGESTWIMSSIDNHVDDDDENKRSMTPVADEKKPYDRVLPELYEAIEKHFSQHDVEIFYKSFGLKNYDVYKGSDLAKMYGCSGPNITLIKQKIINYIKKDETLLDELADLL